MKCHLTHLQQSVVESNHHRIVPKAFTLIELLVVISIISLLIAILLPALGAARQAAQGVQCLSSQRQNGVALMVYAEDYKGHIIPPQQATYTQASRTWGPRMVELDYLGTTQTLFCPSHVPERFQELASRTYGMRVPHSTVSQQPSDDARPLARALRIDAVMSRFGPPSQYLLLGDTHERLGSGPVQIYHFYGQEVQTIQPPATGPYLHARHAAAVNTTYADGHAKAAGIRELTDSTQPNWLRFSAVARGDEP